MKIYKILACLLTGLALFGATHVRAQVPLPYGAPLSNDQAKKAMAAAEAEAKKKSWNVVIAIVDAGGNLMMMQRFDGTQFGSVDVARDKAHATAAFRRPTKAFQDLIAQGGVHLRTLNLTGGTACVLEGGIPIAADGKIVGAVGVSGVTSQQDARIAQAGADSLK